MNYAVCEYVNMTADALLSISKQTRWGGGKARISLFSADWNMLEFMSLLLIVTQITQSTEHRAQRKPENHIHLGKLLPIKQIP